jgi:putative ABC transport system permease protein
VVARRFVEAQLFGVSAGDGLTLATTLGVLVSVAFLACLIPARRAMRVDPVETLKD